MSVDAASSKARVNRKRDAPMVSGFCANEPCGGGGNRGLRPLSGLFTWVELELDAYSEDREETEHSFVVPPNVGIAVCCGIPHLSRR